MEHLITVSIKDFLLTGQFGPVHLSMDRQAVYDYFGPPDDMEYTKRKTQLPSIVVYGNVEFWFSRSNPHQLSGIFSDTFDILRGNQRIHLDSWIIHYGMALDKLVSALSSENIPFWYATPLLTDTRIVCVGPGIIFSFVDSSDGPTLDYLCYTLNHPYKPLSHAE